MERNTLETAGGSPQRLIGPDELGEIVQMSGRRLRELAAEGRIPCYRVGAKVRFNVEEVLTALRAAPAPTEESA